MRRQTGYYALAPGQDSFLDVTTNVVGILIILVMVIGTRATDAMVDAAPDANGPAAVDVETPKAAADALQADIHAIAAKVKREEFEIEYRRRERDKMNLHVAAVQRALDQQRQTLDGARSKQYDLQCELASARLQLETLRQSRQVVDNTVQKPDVIEHLPTPLAKTVFGKQLHFRLLGGRLTYVPFDELVDKLRAEAPQKVWKLNDSPRVTETIGPVLGFRLKYTLKKTQRVTQTQIGVAVQTGVELDRFVLVPVSEDLGEPLEQALREGSEFHTLVDPLDPDHATITVWVYPDSFNAFRTLKQALVQRGFAAAARPLPEGFPIGGAPGGSRSAAE